MHQICEMSISVNNINIYKNKISKHIELLVLVKSTKWGLDNVSFVFYFGLNKWAFIFSRVYITSTPAIGLRSKCGISSNSTLDLPLIDVGENFSSKAVRVFAIPRMSLFRGLFFPLHKKWPFVTVCFHKKTNKYHIR